MGRLILNYADCEHDCAAGGDPGWLVGRNVHDSGIDEAAGDHLPVLFFELLSSTFDIHGKIADCKNIQNNETALRQNGSGQAATSHKL